MKNSDKAKLRRLLEETESELTKIKIADAKETNFILINHLKMARLEERRRTLLEVFGILDI